MLQAWIQIPINQRAYTPIKPLLASIDSISDVASLMKFVTGEAKVFNTSVVAFSVGADNKKSGEIRMPNYHFTKNN